MDMDERYTCIWIKDGYGWMNGRWIGEWKMDMDKRWIWMEGWMDMDERWTWMDGRWME